MLVPFVKATETRFPRQILTTERTAWIFDVDGVLHNYEGAGDILDFYAEIKIAVFSPILPHLSAIDIRDIGLQSFFEKGDGILGYLTHALSSGIIKPEEQALFREKYFRDFHREKFRVAQERNLPLLEGCERTNFLMAALQAEGIRPSFLTQGCRRYWAEPLLNARKLLQFFDLGRSMDLHDCGYVTKKLSTEPIAEALRRHAVDANKCVFVEDSLDNIITAKQYDPRILSVLISPGPVSPDKECFVDIHMPDLVTFLEYARTIFCPLNARPTHDRPDSQHVVSNHPFTQRG